MPERIDSTNRHIRDFEFPPEKRQVKEEDRSKEAPMRPVSPEDCGWSNADTVTNTGFAPTGLLDGRGLRQLDVGDEPAALPSCMDEAELAGRAGALDVAAATEPETVSYPGYECFKIQGSPEYQERVTQYLDTLASTESGQQALEQLEQIHADTGKEILFQEGYCGACAGDPQGNVVIGLDSIDTIAQDYPHLGDDAGPVVLIHELVHAHQMMTGKGPDGYTDEDLNGTPVPISNREREACGLPYDHDDDPNTPMIYSDLSWSENALREELGIPLREAYTKP